VNKYLPFYKIKGNYQQVGEFLGTTFRDKIQKSIEHRRKDIKNYQTYLPKSQECLDITKKYFPNLIVESEAIAKAAGIPLIEFFFENNREVYDPSEEWIKNNVEIIDHCTVVTGFDNQKLVTMKTGQLTSLTTFIY
jgi:hypothetical protein